MVSAEDALFWRYLDAILPPVPPSDVRLCSYDVTAFLPSHPGGKGTVCKLHIALLFQNEGAGAKTRLESEYTVIQ